tara:strand:- start:3527 stop:5464 length:1938 start_codon:yes stop_codon:yes gene_type:complete
MASNSGSSTSNTVVGNGTAGPFTISFDYLNRTDVEVLVDGVLKTETTHYTFDSKFNISFTSGNEPANGANIVFQRNTKVNTARISFSDASVLKALDLNQNNDQVLHAIQELVDDYVKRDGTKTIKGNLSFEGTTEDNNQTSLAVTDPTQDNTITLPNTTGTVITSGDTGTVSSTMITDGTIVNADINASAAISQSKLNIANATTSAAGYQSAADKTKLDGIESNATADQTGAEIKTAYEGEANTNAFTDAEKTKLSGIATGADVTSSNSVGVLNDVDLTGVADNKILKYQASSAKFVIADDTGGGGGSSTFTGLTDSPTNYTGAAGKTVKVNSTADGLEFVDVNTDLDQDSTPQLGGNLDVQSNEINTSTTDGNIILNPNGAGVVEIKGDGTTNGTVGTIKLNCSNNNHGVQIASPPHSAGASYTLTLPNTDGNANQVLKTDGSGGLDWVDQTTDTNTTYTAGAGLSLSGTNEFSVNTLNQDTTGTAAIATTVTVADESSDTTCFPLFSTEATGNLAPKSGSNLTFDSSTGVLESTLVQDSKGNLRSIVQNSQTSAYSLVAADAGKHISITTGGVTIPASEFAAGDAITIINDSASDQTITCSAVTTYLASDTSAKSSLTLKARGVATFLFVSATVVYGAGAGLE